MIHLSAPTNETCVTADVRADVVDFLNDAPSLFTWSVGFYDSCAGVWRQILNPLVAPAEISDSAFDVSRSGSASLHTTVVGWDADAQSSQNVTFDLHWTSRGLSGRDTAVTGTVNSGAFQVVFDSSIQWNAWGSDVFPWAGLWFCRFESPATGQPGCIGQ